MRYTAEIEEKIIAQIEATPDAEIILPDWAYWKGVDQPWVYIDQQPTPLIRHLYESVVGAVGEEQGVANPPGVSKRNVNPRLAVVLPTKRSRTHCPNNHPYTEDDYVEGVGHRCQACRAEKLLGRPSPADINRAKTHCPKNHVLVERPGGYRRCLECAREQTARWRAKRKGTA